VLRSPAAGAALVRSSLRGFAARFGLDVRRASQTSSPAARRLTAIREREIALVLDVGASYGQYAAQLLQSGYRGRIVSFEPLAEPYAVLESRASRQPERWSCAQLAIGERSSRSTMVVAANSVSSSMLPMTPDHLTAAPSSAPAGEQSVTVARLDELAPEILAPGERAFLKLDVQGCELAALRGAQGIIDRVEVAEVELSLVELYEGQPLLEEVYGFLGQSGFRCVGLEPEFVDPVRGYVLQVNGLFVRA
jgi:FkbM family methyltransferase